MQPAPQAPPINRRPTLRRGTLGASMKSMGSMGESSRHLYELQAKEASYEAMMHRFQLRRVSTSSEPVSKFQAEGLIIDKVSASVQRRPHSRAAGLSLARWMRTLTSWKMWSDLFQVLISPILPGSWLVTMHGIIMLAVYHFQLLYLPFAPCYYPTGSEATSIVTMVLELVFLTDLVLNFNTAYKSPTGLVTSRWRIAQRCLNRWFLLDLLSAMPVRGYKYLLHRSLHRMSPWLVKYGTVLMALRVIRFKTVGEDILLSRVVRLGKHMATWFRYSRYSHLLSIAQLMWLVLLIAHYMACIWHVVARNNSHTLVEGGMGEQYVADYYRAMTLIQGEGNFFGTWEENLLSTVAILLGSVILAIVFGNVAMLVSNFNASSTNYHRKMEAVYATMDKMKLPEKLQERIHQYYSHVWSEYESLDGDVVKFQRELTHTLGLEVGLYKYMNLVTEIPFWRDSSPDFATQIILSLAVRVYLPDDYVVRKEETCDEMFMINRGVCIAVDMEEKEKCEEKDEDEEGDVDDADIKDKRQDLRFERQESDSKFSLQADLYERLRSNTVSQVYPKKKYRSPASLKAIARVPQEGSGEGQEPRLLFPGETSGEMSLLMNYKQPLNIRAVTYVEMCILDRATFQRIISRYPDDRRTVLMYMLRDCLEKGEFPFDWDELCDVVRLHRQRNGERNATFTDVDATLTSAEAANALAERLDIDLPDETIRIGFQGAHKSLNEQLPSKRGQTMSDHGLGTSYCRCQGHNTFGSVSNPIETTVVEDLTAPVAAQVAPPASTAEVSSTPSSSVSPIIAENSGGNHDELMTMMRMMTSAVSRMEEELKSVKERLNQMHPAARPLAPGEPVAMSSALALEAGAEMDRFPAERKGRTANTTRVTTRMSPTRPRLRRTSSVDSGGESANLKRDRVLGDQPSLRSKRLIPARFQGRRSGNLLGSIRTACEMQAATTEDQYDMDERSSGVDIGGQNAAPLVGSDKSSTEVTPTGRKPQLRRLFSSTFTRKTVSSIALDDLMREPLSSSARAAEVSLADQLWGRQLGGSNWKQSGKPTDSSRTGDNRRRTVHHVEPPDSASGSQRKLSRLHSLPSELETLNETSHAVDFATMLAQKPATPPGDIENCSQEPTG